MRRKRSAWQTEWRQQLQGAWLKRGELACTLWPVAFVFGLLVKIRRWLYRSGLLRAEALPVPVWVVGNLVVGGAGKTPTVVSLCRWLSQEGRTPGIISRGYGGQAHDVTYVTPESPAAEVGDEPLLLRMRTQAPVVVGRDRVAAAQALITRHPEINVIISDDGLQHLRLPRDFQIIVFDGRGAGNGWLLPAGPLREPLPDRVPERSIVIYNSPCISTPLPGHVCATRLSGALIWPAWRDGQPASPETLEELARLSKDKPIWAAAGIAQPERFFSMLREHGLNITPIPLPDHYDFSTTPWPSSATDVVVTEKDAVKLCLASIETRVWVVPLDLTWTSEVDAALTDALRCSMRPRLN